MASARSIRVWSYVTVFGLAAASAVACGDAQEGTPNPSINPSVGGSVADSGLGIVGAAPDAGQQAVVDSGTSNVNPGATTGGLDAGRVSTTFGGLTAGGLIAGGFTGGGFPGGSALDAGVRDAGSSVTPTGASDAGQVGDGGDQFAALRQTCVDTINMYRAMVGAPPVARANAEQEACSDKGAKYDGDMNVGHASANSGLCKSVGLPGIQNACPGWPIGGFSGNATLADALTKCLAQMWAEGTPPGGVAKCKSDFLSRTDINCFETHGHWINMSDTGNTGVSCGFYKMANGSYWMNQDFLAKGF